MIRNKFSAILGAKRIKISQVSKATGISRTTLTNLYYDRTCNITLDVVDKLCRFLNCKISDLFEYEEDE